MNEWRKKNSKLSNEIRQYHLRDFRSQRDSLNMNKRRYRIVVNANEIRLSLKSMLDTQRGGCEMSNVCHQLMTQGVSFSFLYVRDISTECKLWHIFSVSLEPIAQTHDRLECAQHRKEKKTNSYRSMGDLDLTWMDFLVSFTQLAAVVTKKLQICS